MKIKIHRGLDQIGGCITEISTETSRIFIDLGQNLPGIGERPSPEKDKALVDNLFSTNVKRNQAVIYTHAHGDHVGLFEYVPDNIPQMIGEGAKKLLTLKYDGFFKGKEKQLKKCIDNGADNEEIEQQKLLLDEEASRLAKIKEFKTWKKPSLEIYHKKNYFLLNLIKSWWKEKKSHITIGDIKITPFPTCHSIYDSYMFLIEAEGKRIWHMGDYRRHGYQGQEMMDVLYSYAKDIDVLITEGTMLLHEEECIDENSISLLLQKTMKENKYVFILSSSTDIERLASIKEAAKRIGKELYVCSKMTYRMMGLFNKREARKSKGLFAFHPKCYYETQHLASMKEDGFAMIVGASNLKRVMDIVSKLSDKEEVILVYSAWDGYYKEPEQIEINPNYKLFRDSFSRVVDIHTSGHADRNTIASVISIVNPSTAVVGIHKDANASLVSLHLDKDIKRKIVNTPEIEI